LGALEVIADTYLSVSTPVQVGAPQLLREGASIRAAIRQRVGANLTAARHLAVAHPASSLLPVEGGWSLLVRVPAARTEEQIVLDLLDRERVLVHPGFFFDLPHEAFLVVSLLPASDVFAAGFDRMLRHVHS
jgi:aspartate/methionine/tyrosine aminotransferase